MIRRLIILLLIVGSLFADTVVYNDDILMFKRTKTLSDVSFVDVVPINGKRGVKMLVSSTILGEKHTWIPCDKILELNDDYGFPIEIDCLAKVKKVKDTVHKQSKTNDGAILIGLGGAILAYQNNIDPEDISNLDSWKTTNTIGYALIALGGFIMAAVSN